MLTQNIREVLIHELHTRRVPADRVASYLLIMDKYTAKELASLPCPQCYADGMETPLLITMMNDDMTSAECDRCAAKYDLRARPSN